MNNDDPKDSKETSLRRDLDILVPTGPLVCFPEWSPLRDSSRLSTPGPQIVWAQDQTETETVSDPFSETRTEKGKHLI